MLRKVHIPGATLPKVGKASRAFAINDDLGKQGEH